ncbi:MAG: O-antigen ligase family protein, partial [Bacteroidales bacterium]|nr:O-antigen ligase family protein [Bacteroidales bacterium]
WYGYSLFQLVNPEAQSKVAWFYAMRGVSLYMLLMIPLVLMLMRDHKDLNKFLYLWGILSLLGTFKGFMQVTFGPDHWEQAWLDGGGNITHILFGKLRVFSFYSDAGQFGAAQGHAGVMGIIVYLSSNKRKEKIFFAIVGLAGFYGMFISGTRGAIAVPFAGFFLYLILTRNIKLITIGAILGITVFIFFKYTTVGNEVYAIRRMRTAFDPNDPSLQVRLENQKKLKTYLASRPFGGGIGAAGYWGLRFTPNGFLANVPTDSWYVMIWADQGIVGLYLHLFILFFILIKGSYLAMFTIKNPEIQGKLFALAAGMLGIMAASYGNGVLGQIPTAPIMYTSMAFLFLAKPLEQSLLNENLSNETNK